MRAVAFCSQITFIPAAFKAASWLSVGPFQIGIAGLVPVHPANDGRVVQMNAGGCVLLADHFHSRRFQGRELAFRRSLPKPEVGVKAGSPVLAGVARVLQPNGDREEPRIMGRAMLPFRIRTCGSSSPGRLRAGCAAST